MAYPWRVDGRLESTLGIAILRIDINCQQPGNPVVVSEHVGSELARGEVFVGCFHSFTLIPQKTGKTAVSPDIIRIQPNGLLEFCGGFLKCRDSRLIISC